MSKYDVLKLDNQLSFPLYAASREIIRKYYPFLSEINLTYTQYAVMAVLWEYRRISAKDLGVKLHLDSGTLTPLLKALEERDLVKRERFAEDERVLMLELTPDGEELREQAVGIPVEVMSRIPLDPEETAELKRLLYKIL